MNLFSFQGMLLLDTFMYYIYIYNTDEKKKIKEPATLANLMSSLLKIVAILS